MLNRFIVLLVLFLLFSSPAWGGQNQPEKVQKQPLADSLQKVQQKKTTDQEAVSPPPSSQAASEDDTEDDSSDLDDEHG